MGLLGGGYDLAAPISVLTLSPLHAGSGRSLGVVDLPIQRDGFGYPVVWGSSFKGALRAALSLRDGVPEDCVNLFFGNPLESSESYAGSVFVSDLRPVALSGPCSLGGCFYTSPRLLAQLDSMLEAALSLKLVEGADAGRVASMREQIREVFDSIVMYTGKVLASAPVVEEGGLASFAGAYLRSEQIGVAEGLSDLFYELFRVHYPGDAARSMASRVVLFPEEQARVLFRSRLLLRVTRVALDYRTKTVRRGALWSEEYIPDSSLLAGLFLFSKPRKKNGKGCVSDETAESVSKAFLDYAGARDGAFHLVIGGHETIGKGLVRVALLGLGGGE